MSENLTKRKQQALETRKRILTCALDLFETKGFEDVTIQDIADAAQTSVGSIYRYFKNKEEMAAQNAEPLDDLYVNFYEQLSTHAKYRDLSAMDKLARFYFFVQKAVSSYSTLFPEIIQQPAEPLYLQPPESAGGIHPDGWKPRSLPDLSFPV